MNGAEIVEKDGSFEVESYSIHRCQKTIMCACV